MAYHTADRAITVDGARAAARAASGLGARFLLTSTDLVFDGRAGNYAETYPASPILPYGQAKLEAEAAVRDAAPGAVILRPSLFVGESGIILQPLFECSNLMRGQAVDLYGDEWRSPVHVDDVAGAAWDLVSGEVSGTFHWGGPQRLSRLELGLLLCDMHRFDRRLIREGKRPEDRPRDTSLDSRRLATLLGWQARSLASSSRLPAAAGV